MTVDGFRSGDADAFGAFDPELARRFYSLVTRISRRFPVEIEGIERIPDGRALLVGNHAFGWDVMFAVAAIREKYHRTVWVLGEHAWWKVPFLRRIAAATGTVDGTPENVDELLQRNELVLVLPGGLREAVKPRELRYRLLWGHRYGFVRAAIRNQTPLIPFAAFGADEWFDFIGDAYRRGERWLHRSGIPIPLPARILPIPHLVRLRYVFGEPILPRARPDQADDEEVVRRTRREVEGALHELIETELAKKAGIDPG